MSGVMKEVQKIEGKYKKLDAELRKNELYAWEKENTEDIQFLIDAFKQQQEQIQQLEDALNFYATKYNYETDVINQWEPVIPIMKDEGKKAKEALKQGES